MVNRRTRGAKKTTIPRLWINFIEKSSTRAALSLYTCSLACVPLLPLLLPPPWRLSRVRNSRTISALSYYLLFTIRHCMEFLSFSIFALCLQASIALGCYQLYPIVNDRRDRMKYCSVPGGNQYFSQVKVIGTNETVKLETMEYNIGIIAISAVFLLWIRMIYRYKVWFERWVSNYVMFFEIHVNNVNNGELMVIYNQYQY